MPARRPAGQYCLDRSPIFDQTDVPSATAAGAAQVELRLSEAAAERFGGWTAKSIGLQMGAVLNGQLISVATIVAPTRRAWISDLTETERAVVIDAFAHGAVAKQSPVLPSGGKSDTPADSSCALGVGNGVSPPILIHKQEPEYTEAARTAGIQGTVWLEFVVRPDGMPDSIRVIRPLDPGLDAKAIECLQNLRFRPAQKQGQPVAVKATIGFNFHL
jgi:TonB family protein